MDELIVTEIEAGERLDKVIAGKFPEYSRSIWQQMINGGLVTVGDSVVLPRHELKVGDKIVIASEKITAEIKPSFTLSDATAELDIIFEDDNAIVINKPTDLVTHPSHAHTNDSVVHRILKYNQDIQKAVYDPKNPVSLMRPGIVHRLDKNTTGVLIIAKNKDAMSFLAKQIESRKVKKVYLALLYGWLDESEKVIETWMNRDTSDRRKMTVTEEGKGRESKTIFRIDKLLATAKGDKATLVKANLITGRTHQIRVHAEYIKHPVLGDPIYTYKEARDLSENLGLKRQFLHASELNIMLLGHSKPMTFNAPLPFELQKVLSQFVEQS